MLKRRILSVLLVLAMLVPFAGAAQTAQDNMRGVWVASVANIDYPSSAGMTAQALAAEAGELEREKRQGRKHASGEVGT